MDDWRVLGFEGPVSRELVRAAYCKLALAHHPDRGGDTAYFQRIAEAYHNVASISDEESGKEDSTDPPSPTWIADVPITALFARSWPTCDPTTRHRFRVRFCTETHTWQPPNCVVRVMSGPWSWPSEPYAKWRFEEKGASVPTLYLEMDSNNDDDHDDTQIITSPNGECVALVVPGVITDPCCTYRGVCPNTNLPWIQFPWRLAFCPGRNNLSADCARAAVEAAFVSPVEPHIQSSASCLRRRTVTTLRSLGDVAVDRNCLVDRTAVQSLIDMAAKYVPPTWHLQGQVACLWMLLRSASDMYAYACLPMRNTELFELLLLTTTGRVMESFYRNWVAPHGKVCPYVWRIGRGLQAFEVHFSDIKLSIDGRDPLAIEFKWRRSDNVDKDTKFTLRHFLEAEVCRETWLPLQYNMNVELERMCRELFPRRAGTKRKRLPRYESERAQYWMHLSSVRFGAVFKCQGLLTETLLSAMRSYVSPVYEAALMGVWSPYMELCARAAFSEESVVDYILNECERLNDDEEIEMAVNEWGSLKDCKDWEMEAIVRAGVPMKDGSGFEVYENVKIVSGEPLRDGYRVHLGSSATPRAREVDELRGYAEFVSVSITPESCISLLSAAARETTTVPATSSTTRRQCK